MCWVKTKAPSCGRIETTYETFQLSDDFTGFDSAGKSDGRPIPIILVFGKEISVQNSEPDYYDFWR